ncbi:hypothetical protein UH38_19270 [Aliterella atlantica CENA595]|uniref:Uncharacterized protein n=2 Tax=Aliterella TaxID=1827277 RepID=A0A0D8ZN97_9CYAN|nr:hypothetical protein UH38_19270 [Aliterella atlantica CENA595]
MKIDAENLDKLSIRLIKNGELNLMLIPNEEGKVRLYFTEDKICIGSYDEVAKYEQRTNKSYWASDFFRLPLDYNPIGQSLESIESIKQ